jgi:hypothetical protein
MVEESLPFLLGNMFPPPEQLGHYPVEMLLFTMYR